MTRALDKRKTSPVHRISLTHGQEGLPKFVRENTEQFFAKATRRKSTIVSAKKPVMSNSFQQSSSIQQQLKTKENNEEKYIENRLQTTSTAKPSTPLVVLPPIQTGNNHRQKSISSVSVRGHQPTLPIVQASPCESPEFTTPVMKTPIPIVPKRQFRHGGPVDRDLFRKAYDRALSVARSRLLFHDPYSFAQASSTHGILYSYYDHTPMCIFSHGTDCNHRQDKANKQEKNVRKKIFNDVIVENYIQ